MIVVKYTKMEALKYLSFLDIRNVFQRTLNRAKIFTKLSQGFNPHNLVYFNDPDSLGVESQADYALIDCDFDINRFREKFNVNAPNGLKIVFVGESDKVVFNKIFKYAKYTIKFGHNINFDIKELEGRELINVLYNGKNKIVNLKDSLYEYKLKDNTLELVLSYGQNKLNPFLLVDYLLAGEKNDYTITKNEIYTIIDDKLINVDDLFFDS